jgi:hypothetical protein
MIFEKDVKGINSLLSSKHIYFYKNFIFIKSFYCLEFSEEKEILDKILNSLDLRGNSPVMLCVMLRSTDVKNN